MTRRRLLELAFAPQQVQYRTYARCLPDYLTRLAAEAYQRRARALDALRTPADIGARQRWVRETFWKLVGGEPLRTPLHVKTVGTFRRSGYRVDKITYESQPEIVIPANLYIPDGSGPFPGVLFQMGHTLNGKAAEAYQKCCQGLARLGYVVLAFDPMGQGERTYYPKPGGTLTRLSSADEEHTLPGRQMLLAGKTATLFQTWDAVRSLDVLAAHPSVDPARLASTGNSGGGTLTMMLAAVDERLACAAIACGNTENFACRDFLAPGSVDDAEQDFIGAGPLGFDRWDTLYPMAPKPVAFLNSARDFFGTYSANYLTSGREEFARLERVYATLGHTDRLRWVESPLPHNLSEPLRIEIYQWFERWLKNSSQLIEKEPPVTPEPDQVLWCGPSGNVVRDFASNTPRQTIPAAKQASVDWAKLTGAVNPATARLTVLAETRFGAIRVQGVEAPTADKEVFVPGWFYQPESAKRALIVLDPAGRAARWQEGNLYHQLALRGVAVCAMDVRGIGDLRPELGRGPANYAQSHSTEDYWAWASLMLGQPLIGQRVTDILAMCAALRAKGFAVELAAAGRLIPPALLAAVMEPAIEGVVISSRVPSYREIAAAEQYNEPMAHWIPNVLSFSDLPDAARSLGARLRVAARWDADSLFTG